MTLAVFRRKCTRVQETDEARAEAGKGPMLFLDLTSAIVDAVFNVTSPNADIKTEDGLSHSPGQTGLLGYSNFSGTPPSQSLYGYSHTHGQSHTLTHTLRTPALISAFAGRSIHLLLPSFLFSSSRLSFSLPHLFSISCGLDFWRQTSPPPPYFSPLGVRPAFSAQTSGAKPRSLSLLGKTRAQRKHGELQRMEERKMENNNRDRIDGSNRRAQRGCVCLSLCVHSSAVRRPERLAPSIFTALKAA